MQLVADTVGNNADAVGNIADSGVWRKCPLF